MSVYCKYSFILPTIPKPACKKLNILGFLRLDGKAMVHLSPKHKKLSVNGLMGITV
jgi:hypothetical protein